MKKFLADGKAVDVGNFGSVDDIFLGHPKRPKGDQLQLAYISREVKNHYTRRELYPTPSVDYLARYRGGVYICINPFDYLLTDVQTVEAVDKARTAMRYIINKRARGKELHFNGVYSIKVEEYGTDGNRPYIAILSRASVRENIFLVLELLRAFDVTFSVILRHDLEKLYTRMAIWDKSRSTENEVVVVAGNVVEVWRQVQEQFYRDNYNGLGVRNYQTFGKYYSRPDSVTNRIFIKGNNNINGNRYSNYIRSLNAFGGRYNPYIAYRLRNG